MSRVDRERRQHGVHVLFENAGELISFLLLEIVPVDDLEAAALKSGPNAAIERLRVAFHQLVDPVAYRMELVSRRQPVRRSTPHAGGDLLAQARDADLEELVEIAAEDGEECGALDGRARIVFGEREDTLVEVEP